MTAPQLNVYHSATKSLQTVTPAGTRIVFINGVYYTHRQEEIDFLDTLVADRRGIYVDPKQVTISEAERDPMTALRNKLRAELLAEMQAQINPQNDRGESVQGRFNPSSTTDAAPIAAGGDATQLHAQVQKLVADKTKG